MKFPRQDFYKQQAVRHYDPFNLYLLLFKKNTKYKFKLIFIYSIQPG